jgi:oligopeptide/dipeptide ABC transporter ATP-binding protein
MTALAIAGLVPYPGRVEAATLTLEGADLRHLAGAARDRLLGTRLAMVFQDPMSSLNTALRVGRQHTEGAEVHRRLGHREALRLAADRLRDVHVSVPERRLRQYPHEFSGGMRQRAMIAMGLMNEPALILADEPTTALDVTVQAQVIDVLREANEAHGTAVVLISHNIGVVAELCARVLVMYAGRIVEDVSAATLLSGPAHPYTRALISAVPGLTADRARPLATIPGRPPDLAALPAGCAFAPRCAYAVDRCHRERPPLIPLADAHAAACWVAAGLAGPAPQPRTLESRV